MGECADLGRHSRVATAIFAATGKRMRKLPIGVEAAGVNGTLSPTLMETPVQRIHHQVQGHGDGFVDLPLDLRVPRWADMGLPQCRTRRNVSLHPAGGGRDRIVIANTGVPGGHPKLEGDRLFRASLVFLASRHRSIQSAILAGPVPRRAMKEEPQSQPVVLVVDDDASMRNALANLFRSVGLQSAVFGSGSELLWSKLPDVPSCLVLDVRLPGLSGLDFQAELAKANIRMPIIFMTGHGDIPMSVQAMKAGAVDFLSKPFRDQDMLDAVATAIERDRKRRESEKVVAGLRRLFETLTAREREVMVLVTAGLMNKQIAAELGVSEITVKIYRGHTMKKMGARSLADLVRMAEVLGIRRAQP